MQSELPSPSGYVLAPTREDSSPTAACREARWDPSSPGALGVAFEDGSFCYITSLGSQSLRLFAATQPLGAWPSIDGDGISRPAPNRTTWAHWSFVPGRAAELVLVHAFSKQVFLATLPRTAQPRRVMLCRELPRPSPICALEVCSLGEWVGAGQADGTVTFFPLGSVLGGLPQPGNEALVSEHPEAQRGSVTSIALLRAASPQHGVEAALGCSGYQDGTLVVWDLNAGAALHCLLTANPAVISALSLQLLPPYTAATGSLAEPSVLLAAGSADGGVQLWGLTGGGPPTLRACWQHSSQTAVLALIHTGDASSATASRDTIAGGTDELAAADGARLLSVSSDGRLEEHSAADWSLIATHAMSEADPRLERADLVSAHFESSTGQDGAMAAGCLLLARATGLLSRWAPSLPRAAAPAVDVVPTESGPSLTADEAVPIPVPPVSAEVAVPHAVSAQVEAETVVVPPAQARAQVEEDEAPRTLIPQATTTPPRANTATFVLPPRPQPPTLPTSPTPIPAKFDNPHRVLALLDADAPVDGQALLDADAWTDGGVRVEGAAASLPTGALAAILAEEDGEGSGGGQRRVRWPKAFLHPLATPAPNSSLRLQREHSALAAQTFEASALPVIGDELQRKARRDATAELNTPPARSDRYERLTPLEPRSATIVRASQRRREHHSPWLAMRKLEPALDELFSPEREVEVVDMRRDLELPLSYLEPQAQPEVVLDEVVRRGAAPALNQGRDHGSAQRYLSLQDARHLVH